MLELAMHVLFAVIVLRFKEPDASSAMVLEGMPVKECTDSAFPPGGAAPGGTCTSIHSLFSAIGTPGEQTFYALDDSVCSRN